MYSYFTSESVTEGHPDKVCDRISDAVLDALLAQDPESRCACETSATPEEVCVMGEVTSKACVDYEALVREILREVGYEDYASRVKTSVHIHSQSPDIDGAVTKTDGQLGAGDQGIMFGYATNETESFMPLPFRLATTLASELALLRRRGKCSWLRSDGKTQVTVRYEGDRAVSLDCIVVSAQHTEDISQDEIRDALYKYLIVPTISQTGLDYSKCRFLINPSGRFVLGGPDADSGLTGRKIIVDTYGGAARHGGGAFSGKDPSKVDRSGAYMARKIAKTIVSSGVAKRCEVQLGYAIGIAEPVSVFVDTFGTSSVPDEVLTVWVRENFDLRPASIIASLDLKRPIYKRLSSYGHFGRPELDLTWERLDNEIVESLRKKA